MKRRNVSQALAEELPYWHRTGEQDWRNVGSPLEDAQEAGIRATDDRTVARAKLLKMLLRNETIHDHGGAGIEGSWTDAEKRKLLLAWAQGWASAAARSCLEAIREQGHEQERDDGGW